MRNFRLFFRIRVKSLSLRNAPNSISHNSRARLSNNFELKSRTAWPAFPSLCTAHSDAFATRRTRPASRYARSNAKFISRFRSGLRWESRKVTRGIFDTGWACRASSIDLTDSFSVFHKSSPNIITLPITIGLLFTKL